jgi:hypothetical protein
MGLMRSGPDNPSPKTSTTAKFLWLTALFIFVLLIAALALR